MTMRAVVVTQNDPFYTPVFFQRFLENLDENVELEAVVVLPTFNESTFASVKRALVLFGVTRFIRKGSQFVVRVLLDAMGVRAYSVSSLMDRAGVPVWSLVSVNTDWFRSAIEEREVDVVLSVAAPEVFDEALLAAPTWGCVNVHTSALPKYRGMMPTFWALYHGDEEVGVTVHTMAPEIDRGKIVHQTTFPVPERASLDEVIQEGKRVGADLAAAALGDIAAGRVELRPMEGEGSYHSFPTREERREFQRRGGRLV